MKRLLFLFTLLAISVVMKANAATVPLFQLGEYVFAGTLYVDNDAANNGSFSEAAGVGNITEIRDGGGLLFWDNSTEELNMSFSGFNRNALVPGLGGTTQFSSDGGIVDFWTNSLGTFQATGDYILDTIAISGGALRLSLTGAIDTFGNSAVGQFSPTAYSSNGQLDVVGGEWLNVFDTNLIMLGDGTIVDTTFNISGDNTATAGYDFSGSADLATNAVPEPEPMLLLSLGLLAAGYIGRTKPV